MGHPCGDPEDSHSTCRLHKIDSVAAGLDQLIQEIKSKKAEPEAEISGQRKEQEELEKPWARRRQRGKPSGKCRRLPSAPSKAHQVPARWHTSTK